MDILFLQQKAREVRIKMIEMLVDAGSGHMAGPLGAVEFFVSMYSGGLLKFDNNKPDWSERDRLVISPGHYAPALYVVMAMAGFFPKEELMTLRRLGSRLQGHPIRDMLPGVENCSGSLGQGLSVAVGMAMAARIQKKNWMTVALLSDGEHNEGQIWEGYMLMAKENLNNLIVFVDYNNIQIDGRGDEVMPLLPLVEKLRSFNLNVMEIDGNNFEQIFNAYEMAKKFSSKPTVVVMNTVAGKGVGFMENNYQWHGKVPTKEEGERAIKELSS